MSILDIFLTDEQRDRMKVREDNAHKAYWTQEAERVIQSRLIGTQLWISINGIPVFRVTSESNVRNNTIAVADVDSFVATIRETYVNIHISSSLPTKRR